jgi:hypothetical protein
MLAAQRADDGGRHGGLRGSGAASNTTTSCPSRTTAQARSSSSRCRLRRARHADTRRLAALLRTRPDTLVRFYALDRELQTVLLLLAHTAGLHELRTTPTAPTVATTGTPRRRWHPTVEDALALDADIRDPTLRTSRSSRLSAAGREHDALVARGGRGGGRRDRRSTFAPSPRSASGDTVDISLSPRAADSDLLMPDPRFPPEHRRRSALSRLRLGGSCLSGQREGGRRTEIMPAR